MAFTIYHNPNCGTSRNTLALLKEAGLAPTVVEYLKTPLSKAALKALVAKTGGNVRGIVREKEALYAELGLADASDEALFEALAAHPVLVNRPIVENDDRAALCRPAKTVKTLF